MLLAWAAAVVVILVTARIVASDLASLHRRAHALGADVPVVLAARDLTLGATLRASDLRIVHRPSSTVPRDAFRRPADAVGRVVAVPLVRDDVVDARHVAPGGAPGLAGVVADGRRAVHVQLKDGFRPPVGAVVDVLATYDPTAGAAAGRASEVATGAQVLAVDGGDPGADNGASASGTGVALLVTADEAPAVAYAAAVGTVAVVLAPVASACCRAGAP